jgi:hypothetical protein
MAKPLDAGTGANGLWRNPNDLNAPEGSLSVADEALIYRDGILDKRRGFEKCNNFLPLERPKQLFNQNGRLFVNIKDLLYVKDSQICDYLPFSTAVIGFSFVQGILFQNDNTLFVADDDIIRKYDFTTSLMSTPIGIYGSTGSTDGVGTAARLNNPAGLSYDATSQFVYFSDSGNYTIRVFPASTFSVTTVAGAVGISGIVDGVGAAARFRSVYHTQVSGGYLYMTDFIGQVTRRMEIATATVTTLCGTAFAAGSADGVGAAARFDGPSGFCIVNGADMYVCDQINHTIRKIVLATNTVTTVAGLAGVPGSVDGIGNAARFNLPADIKQKDNDTLYICSFGENKIRKFTISTGQVTTVAGTGVAGWSDGDGLTQSKFSGPSFMGIGTIYGDIFVTDQTSNRAIRRYHPDAGIVSTFAYDSISPVGKVTDGYLISQLIGPD